MTLKEKMVKLKDLLGITTEEISQRTGLSVGALNKIFTGETNDPRITTLYKIKNGLGTSLDYLIDSQTNEPFAETKAPLEIRMPTPKEDLTYPRILNAVKNLNHDGKIKVAEYAEDLVASDRYANVKILNPASENDLTLEKYDDIQPPVLLKSVSAARDGEPSRISTDPEERRKMLEMHEKFKNKEYPDFL